MTFLDPATPGSPSDPADIQSQPPASPLGPEDDNATIGQAPYAAQPAPGPHDHLLRWIDSKNIADELDDDLLNEIAQRVKREFDIDDESRADWVEKTERSMDLAMQVAETKQYPWPNASNVIFPLMTTAALQFAARAYPAIVAGRNVVKGVVIGPDDGIPAMNPQTGQPMVQQTPAGPQPQWVVPPFAKRMRALEIGDHMSWQLLDEMSEWEPETDKLLHILPIVGSAFRKSYFDPAKGRNVALLCSAMNVVINYGAKSVESAPRITEKIELYPLEIEDNERAGVFSKIDYSHEPDSNGDDDAPRKFLEQHRWLDLDDDGYPEPYVVTMHQASTKVVRIVARYDRESVKLKPSHEILRIEPVHYYTPYEFLPNPEGSVYGLGFGQLLGPINEAVNTSLNMLIDGGHLANTGGGFIGKNLSMHTGAVRFRPGEYKVINVSGAVAKDNIVPLTFPGPSMVLFQLLELLIQAGKDVSAVKDVLTGDQQQHNVPATTTLALIEQGLKVFTAIYKRVYRSLKAEFEKLYRLNRIYLPMISQYQAGEGEWKTITQQAYQAGAGIAPWSDPSMVSDTQRLGHAQFLMGFMQDPGFNGMEIRRRILDAAQIESPEKLLAQQIPPNPMMMLKQGELQIRGAEAEAVIRQKRAAEVRDYAQAILMMAQADAAVGDQHLQWLDQHLKAWEATMKAATDTMQPGSDGAPPSGPQTPLPPGPAPSPGPNPHLPAVGAMSPDQIASPLGAARQARDGNWYVPDPSRKGKYLMIKHG